VSVKGQHKDPVTVEQCCVLTVVAVTVIYTWNKIA
jgi:hypothetical protein